MINTVEEGLELLELVGSPWLQLHLDTYHMNIEERDIANSIRLAQGKSAMCMSQTVTAGM